MKVANCKIKITKDLTYEQVSQQIDEAEENAVDINYEGKILILKDILQNYINEIDILVKYYNDNPIQKEEIELFDFIKEFPYYIKHNIEGILNK